VSSHIRERHWSMGIAVPVYRGQKSLTKAFNRHRNPSASDYLGRIWGRLEAT
jgi:hypothetical protein